MGIEIRCGICDATFHVADPRVAWVCPTCGARRVWSSESQFEWSASAGSQPEVDAPRGFAGVAQFEAGA